MKYLIAIIVGFSLIFGLAYASMQIKLGIRTAACINQKMTPEDCSNWQNIWDKVGTF